jgi:hypothetical protein
MKKATVIILLCFAILGRGEAQEIRASPLEGCWVWDKKGVDAPYYNELVFFGNVMLMADEYGYEGDVFSYTNQTIKTADGDFELRYRLSGNALTITNDRSEQFTYTKAGAVRCPIEGIWKVTGGESYLPSQDRFILFTRDIMAAKDGEEEYEGFKVQYRGNYIIPVFDNDEYFTEEELMEEAMQFTVSGRDLILSFDDEEMTLTRVY